MIILLLLLLTAPLFDTLFYLKSLNEIEKTYFEVDSDSEKIGGCFVLEKDVSDRE